MRVASILLFLLAAMVNLAPVAGVLSADRLEAFYGIVLGDPNLVILMRHRAVLFGIVGAILVVSAFRSRWRMLGLCAGLVSMLSFVVVAALVGGANDELRKVALIDGVASLLLVAGWIVGRLDERASPNGEGAQG